MALVVVVAVAVADVGSVELQRERLTVSSVELQRLTAKCRKEQQLASYNNAMSSCYKFS